MGEFFFIVSFRIIYTFFSLYSFITSYLWGKSFKKEHLLVILLFSPLLYGGESWD